jgi:cellobiose phosphorylase
VQNLVPFFNVGEHNTIRLEGADWNDAMDMASQRGESVAFTAFYASNLRDLSQLVLELEKQGETSIELASELMLLLDSLTEPVNYDVVADKQQRLQDYFAVCRHTLSGQKARVTLSDLSKDLAAKADWLFKHLRQSEWLKNREGYEWFNGYYDNDGQRVEGDHANGVRMTLTGQVFTLMGGIADGEQAQHIVRSVQRYLIDPQVGGPRLNTDFGEVAHNLGRCFGFAFGTKENGAMFSHMAVMYAKALYQRGFVREGYQVLEGIYRHCQNFAASRIYPGIPEYIDAKGRGAYPYLTGSASWLLLTMLTESFGVKGRSGDLAFEPKLVREQFDAAGLAAVVTLFADRQLEVVYHNPARLDYADYHIEGIRIDAVPVEFQSSGRAGIIARRVIEGLNRQPRHRIDVRLG